MAARKIPTPKYDYNVKKILKIYQQAREEILVDLLKLVESTPDDSIRINLAASLIRQIDFILAQANVEIQKTVEEMILETFNEGQASLLYAVGEYDSIADATKGVSFSMLSKHMVDAMIADTYTDLLSATDNMSKRLKRIVRQTVAEQMRVNAIKRFGRKHNVKGIVSKLTKKGFSKELDEEGFVGIVDRSGRRWKLNHYVETVVRTKIQQAHVEGMRVQGIERGIDLALISTHGAEDDCRKYEGIVISMNGLTEGFLTYDELRKSNEIFHPNCQHTLYPIRSLDQLSEEERRIHFAKMKKLK
jgi:Phage minor capsid protein 2